MAQKVTIRRLIDPQAVRVEIGTDRDLRQAQLAARAQRRDQLGGQEMGVDHQVPLLVVQERSKAQVELLHGLPQPIARPRPDFAIPFQPVVEIPDEVREIIHQI